MTFTPGGTQRLDPLIWLGLPLLAVIIPTVLLAAPIRIFGLGLPEPVFALVLAFAWPAIRPSMFAPFLLVLLGLFLDLLWGGPLGLWPLALAVVYGLVLAIRPTLTGRDGVFMWVWYAVACLLAFGVGAVVTLVKDDHAPSLISLFWQYSVTVLLYPFADRLIERFEDADVRFR
jgi:rod shape-determining protein MreD